MGADPVASGLHPGQSSGTVPESRDQGPDRGGGGRRLSLNTRRLRVTALTLEALQAWVDGDAERLRAETGVVFDVPVESPPLFGEDLPRFRDRMAETPHELGWWAWLVSRVEDGRAVGVCGLGGHPDGHGTAVLGYAVYPHEEGRGYATEAARAVMTWALGQPGVKRVRATVPSWNLASVAVARKLGMAEVAHEIHEGVGEVTIYEAGRRADPDAGANGWPELVHQALSEAGVTLVGYVPDSGHKRLIELCEADPAIRAVPLTSEEEGVGLSSGGWLGGARCTLLMQSSGVGTLMNALAMAKECRFPLVLLVTMRGEDGEANPWQVPMGRAAATLLGEMGVETVRVEEAAEVAPAVRDALVRTFEAEAMTAVLIAQRIVGVKRFEETSR